MPRVYEDIQVKKISESVSLPEAGEAQSFVTLTARLDTVVTLYPNQTNMIPCGIALKLPSGVIGIISSIPSLSAQKVSLEDKIGFVTPEDEGEINVALHNSSRNDIKIENGQEIARILFVPMFLSNFLPVSSFGSNASNIVLQKKELEKEAVAEVTPAAPSNFEKVIIRMINITRNTGEDLGEEVFATGGILNIEFDAIMDKKTFRKFINSFSNRECRGFLTLEEVDYSLRNLGIEHDDIKYFFDKSADIAKNVYYNSVEGNAPIDIEHCRKTDEVNYIYSEVSALFLEDDDNCTYTRTFLYKNEGNTYKLSIKENENSYDETAKLRITYLDYNDSIHNYQTETEILKNSDFYNIIGHGMFRKFLGISFVEQLNQEYLFRQFIENCKYS